MDPLTKEDLNQLRRDLVNDIRQILKPNQQTGKWLKSYQVLKMLNMSSGKLQLLRNNGTLKFTRVGRLIYYDVDDVNRLMENGTRREAC